MLEIKIDLVPMGIRERTKQIGFVKIWNDASGTSEIGNYKYEVRDENDEFAIRGEYKGFRRLEKTVFHLMRDILNKTLHD
jgi:hypothetical protein